MKVKCRLIVALFTVHAGPQGQPYQHSAAQ